MLLCAKCIDILWQCVPPNILGGIPGIRMHVDEQIHWRIDYVLFLYSAVATLTCAAKLMLINVMIHSYKAFHLILFLRVHTHASCICPQEITIHRHRALVFRWSYKRALLCLFTLFFYHIIISDSIERISFCTRVNGKIKSNCTSPQW